MNSLDASSIINKWKMYSKEISFKEIQSHKSYARMFHKFETEILYSLIRSEKPQRILELGCFHGQTSNIIINAIVKNNTPCELISSDLLDHSAYMDYNDEVTSRRLVVGDSKETITSDFGKIDFLFIDSDHTYDFAQWYCKTCVPLVEIGSYVLIHDWEGVDGDKDDEFKSVIENAVNTGKLKRCMNLMEYVKSNPHLSLTPKTIRYAKGDRSPTEVLRKI
jgi:cephalosporin hydroxylase